MTTLMTLVVVIIAVSVIWVTRPLVGLIVYLATMCVYPQYLAVTIGSIDLSSGRIIVLALLVRILTRPLDPVLMRIRVIDALVAFSFLCAVLAFLTTESPTKVIEREGGRFLDTILAYAVTRLTLRTRHDAYALINSLVLVGLPLALVGIYQSITGHNPYSWMREFSPFDIGQQEMYRRMGLYRADGSFGNKISWGLFFAILVPLQASMLFVGQPNYLKFTWRVVLLTIGVISSMSSAPILALMVSFVLIGSFPVRQTWPYVVLAFVAFCAVLEVASDRHFYYVLTRFALDSSTAYYRIELVEEALGGGMSGRWITGFGYVGVGADWGRNGFAWRHPDLANIYIYQLATTGLLGMLSYWLMNGYYYWCLFRAGRAATTLQDKWSIWCIASGMIAWNVAMLTVAALAQTNNLLYVLIALAGSSRIIFRDEPVEAPVAPVNTIPLPRARRPLGPQTLR